MGEVPCQHSPAFSRWNAFEKGTTAALSPPVTDSTAIATSSPASFELKEKCVGAFRAMQLARVLEERLASVYRAGGRIVGGVYLGKGQEAFSAGLCVHLQKGKDIFGPLIRDQAGRLAFGEPLLDAPRTFLGALTGPMRGRDGNVHRGRPKEGLLAMISHLGSLVSVVNGMLFQRRLQGRLGDAVGATSIGEGGTSTGAFHEGLNQAAVEKLPLIVSVANNQYAYSTTNDRQFACESIVERARGYGIEGYAIDATDLVACVETFGRAVKRAREGHGPQMVVGAMLRLTGHGEHDDASYIPDEQRKSKLGRDCLALAEQRLVGNGWVREGDIRDWRAQCLAEVDAAMAQASKEPTPDPYRESWRALSAADLVEGQYEA